MLELKKLDHIAILVKDPESSATWYHDTLGLKRLEVEDWGQIPIFMVTENYTGVAIFYSEKGNPDPMPKDKNHHNPHIAFAVKPEMFLEAQKYFKEQKISFVFQDHQIAHSIYFRDPDDYCMEITTYYT